jgi:nucleoside-diphosphate-sugar epimerase
VRVLVTGCAGFIGSQVTEELVKRGAQVRGADAFTEYYDPTAKRANLAPVLSMPGFELVEADLRDCDIDALLSGIDVVVHEAGQPGVRVSWGDGFPTYVEHNVLATQRLLEAVRRHSIDRLVYASSSSVYGNAPRYPTTEEDLPHPHSPYGVTKLAAEHLCGLYAENWGIPTVSLRYFSVYGPRQRPDMGFSRFLSAALQDKPVEIYGDGEQIRDFTFVEDVVAATLAAIEADVAPGTVCNVAGGSSVTVNELVELLECLIGRELPVEHREEQPGDVRRTGGTIDRARDLLRWEPNTSLEHGLARQLEWTRSRLRL